MTDISSPHHAEQDAEVLKVLRELGVEDRPRLHVLNKIDRLSEQELKALRDSNGRGENTVFTSAFTGEGLDELLRRSMRRCPWIGWCGSVCACPSRMAASIRGAGKRARASTEVDDGGLDLEAVVPESAARELREFILE